MLQENNNKVVSADLEALRLLMLDTIYPIGSIYMSVNNTSPSNLFGGDWEQIKDTFLLTAGDDYTAGDTGGEATHILTTDEAPAHTHTRGTMNITGGLSGVDGAGNMAYTWGFKAKTDGAFTVAQTGATYNKFGGVYSVNYGANAVFNAANSWTGETSSAGGGVAHNNMPPYLVVYCWQRVA